MACSVKHYVNIPVFLLHVANYRKIASQDLMNHSTDRYVIGDYLKKYFAKENHIIHVQISYSANDGNITQNHWYIFVCYGYRLRSQTEIQALTFAANCVKYAWVSHISICYYKLYILTSDTLVYVDDITTITIRYNLEPPNTERYSQFVFVDMRYRKYLPINVWILVTSKCY